VAKVSRPLQLVRAALECFAAFIIPRVYNSVDSERAAAPMARVHDVAQYILRKFGEDDRLPVTTWKLQKLVYYSQAWSLVWDDEPLFPEPVKAWANGPVCPALYAEHRGQFKIRDLPAGDPTALSETQRETIDIVFDHYSHKTAQYLSELTHREKPWLKARTGLEPGERGNSEITLASMAEYYGSL
jgi:uncharacterized phage-associated protein